MAEDKKKVETPKDDKPDEDKKEKNDDKPEEKKDEDKKSPRVSTNADVIEDNPKVEYEQLLIKVKNQNERFNSLKLKLIELECDECICNTIDEIHQVRCCLEVEKENLRLLVKEVVKFQRDHPNGPWEEIEIATHLSEDNIPDAKDAALCTAMIRMQQAKECKDQR